MGFFRSGLWLFLAASTIDDAINFLRALSQASHNFKTTLKAYNEAFRGGDRAEVAA